MKPTNQVLANANNHERAEPVDIWKARRFIDQQFAEHLSLKKVASAAGISCGHLSEKFKQITGMKFVDYIQQVRFAHACARLTDTIAPISEIAFGAGFQSLSQFNRVFKRLSGKSPTAYRTAKRKQQAKPS